MDGVGLLGYETAKDLFGKLKMDYIAFEKEECSSNYMNFIFTANHLKEWIKYDITLSKEFKSRAKKLLKNSNHNIFNNLANRGKHYVATGEQRIETQDAVTAGFNFAEMDIRRFGMQPRKYLVRVNGTILPLKDECKKILDTYIEIFK